MEESVSIILSGVHHAYQEQPVLHDINLSIPSGSIYGILGPSGCGKTTTVKIIAGLLKPQEGQVQVLDSPLPDLSVMNRIGYLAQSDALYGDLTGLENLRFFGQLYGLKGQGLRDSIDRVLQLVHLQHELDKPVNSYSGGMKRRLSLAIALVHRPEILLLDEPTVGIDPLLRQEIWSEFTRLSEEGITLLITTHVMDEAIKCSHLSMMRQGRILASGSPSEIIRSCGAEDLEEAFLTLSRGGSEDES